MKNNFDFDFKNLVICKCCNCGITSLVDLEKGRKCNCGGYVSPVIEEKKPNIFHGNFLRYKKQMIDCGKERTPSSISLYTKIKPIEDLWSISTERTMDFFMIDKVAYQKELIESIANKVFKVEEVVQYENGSVHYVITTNSRTLKIPSSMTSINFDKPQKKEIKFSHSYEVLGKIILEKNLCYFLDNEDEFYKLEDKILYKLSKVDGEMNEFSKWEKAVLGHDMYYTKYKKLHTFKIDEIGIGKYLSLYDFNVYEFRNGKILTPIDKIGVLRKDFIKL